MRVGMHVAVGLGIFLGLAALVYGITAYEWRGTALLLVCAVGFLYVGLVLRGSRRPPSAPITPEPGATEESAAQEPHIGPTIWPFVVSLGAVLLVVGIVGALWFLVPAIILLAGAGAGWFLDIKRQWDQSEIAAAHIEASQGGPSSLERQEQPDEGDRE